MKWQAMTRKHTEDREVVENVTVLHKIQSFQHVVIWVILPQGTFPLKTMIMLMCTNFGCIANGWRIGAKLFQRKHNEKNQVGVWSFPSSCDTPFLLICCNISRTRTWANRVALIQSLDFLQESKSNKPLFKEWKHYYFKEQNRAHKYPQENKREQMLVWNLIFPVVPLG